MGNVEFFYILGSQIFPTVVSQLICFNLIDSFKKINTRTNLFLRMQRKQSMKITNKTQNDDSPAPPVTDNYGKIITI